MSRSIPEQDINAIRRNQAKREDQGLQSRVSAETRIAKQILHLDNGISWSEALRTSKDLLDALPQGANLDTVTLADLQDLSEPDSGPQF